MTQAVNQKKYAQLLSKTLPRPIASDSQLKTALSVTARLMQREELAAEETVLLKMLSILIAEYERTRYADLFQKLTPAEALTYLMDENRLSQRDFPGIPQSRISDILAGRRKISKSQARMFGERCKVSPALFLG